MVQARAADLRGLKALVVGLGLLVVLGTALVIGVVIKRMYAGPAPASTVLGVPGMVSVSAAAGVPLELPVGSTIAGVASADGVFAVIVNGPGGGGQLWIIDPRTGARAVAMKVSK